MNEDINLVLNEYLEEEGRWLSNVPELSLTIKTDDNKTPKGELRHALRVCKIVSGLGYRVPGFHWHLPSLRRHFLGQKRHRSNHKELLELGVRYGIKPPKEAKWELETKNRVKKALQQIKARS